MDWQQHAALLIVAVTAMVMLWQRWAPHKARFRRRCACQGCPAAEPARGLRPPLVKGARPLQVHKAE